MKKPIPAKNRIRSSFFLIAILLLSTIVHSQQQRVKITKDNSSFINDNGDSSYVFNSILYASPLNSISSVTLVTWNYSSSVWSIAKDTSYTVSQIANTSNNTPYGICKPNQNVLKVCLGRLHFNTRKRFTFYLMKTDNTILTKQLEF